jgi:hypothetical protein
MVEVAESGRKELSLGATSHIRRRDVAHACTISFRAHVSREVGVPGAIGGVEAEPAYVLTPPCCFWKRVTASH